MRATSCKLFFDAVEILHARAGLEFVCVLGHDGIAKLDEEFVEDSLFAPRDVSRPPFSAINFFSASPLKHLVGHITVLVQVHVDVVAISANALARPILR